MRRVEFAYALAALLALAAAVGLSLNVRPGQMLNYGQVATVNHRGISQAEYQRALSAMQNGLDRALTRDDRERALHLLIDEELLVQNALNLGLANEDRLIRKNLVQALMASAIAARKAEPDESQLHDFYRQNQALFTEPRASTLEVLAATEPFDASQFLRALDEGAGFSEAGERNGFQMIEMPQELPLAKIGDLLGGPARDTVAGMQEGDIAGPVESLGRKLFIWLKQDRGGPLTFAEARDAVYMEWQRRNDEHTLQTYLAELRRKARIDIHTADSEYR